MFNELKETVFTVDDDGNKYYFKDLLKSQKDIDKLSDEDLQKLNSLVDSWTTSVYYKMRLRLTDRQPFLRYAYRRYRALLKDKSEKHPMWRSKGAIELVLLELGLKRDNTYYEWT